MLWAFAVGVLIAAILGMIVFTALTRDINPPSNVELLDPKTLHLSGEFAEQNLGTTVAPDGGVTVRVVATQWGGGGGVFFFFFFFGFFFFLVFGLGVGGGGGGGTNVNAMVVPGFVAQVYTEFTQA